MTPSTVRTRPGVYTWARPAGGVDTDADGDAGFDDDADAEGDAGFDDDADAEGEGDPGGTGPLQAVPFRV
jgi:hypothetical protein